MCPLDAPRLAGFNGNEIFFTLVYFFNQKAESIFYRYKKLLPANDEE